MKKLLNVLTLGLALVAWASCTEIGPDTINEITDHYTAPANAVELSSLSSSASTWANDRRFFDLSFSGDGASFSTRLVGYGALLEAGQYVVVPEAEAQIGQAVAEKTLLDGKAVSSGYVLVSRNGNQYQITVVVPDKDACLTWKGNLGFKEDPAPTSLPVVMSAQSNVPNGTNSLTINLATEGISQEFDMTTWQTVWKGEGGYLALDIFSDDGYLHEGVYKPSAVGGVINAGEFGIGWDPGDIYNIGYPFTDWGTCWWTVSNGATSAAKITDGIVTVTRTEEGWRIAWGKNYPVEYLFEGAIPALTKPEKPDGPASLDYTYEVAELQPVTDQSGAVVSGVLKHPVTIYDKSKNVRAYLEFLLAEGQTDYSGSYPSTSYASQAGQLADGWEFDGTAWGMGFMEGGSYYIDDAGNKIRLTAGAYTVEVTKIATGAYRFTCSIFDLAAAGPDYDPASGGGEGGDDVSGDVVLKINSGLTYSMEDQTASNTSASGAALSGVTLWRVSVNQGSDLVANFDLVVAAGSQDLAGTYTVMSYPDEVGKAGNGWGFASWNMFGGCYFKVDGKYYFIPNDATVTVSSNSDGSLKFKFTGSVQDENYADAGVGGLLLDNVAKK
ncbi:MAG: hypothetical protein IKZ51_05400 [Bacteroidales bacterium]|nr:hypothetical protein [Bacteroidales bacterium]